MQHIRDPHAAHAIRIRGGYSHRVAFLVGQDGGRVVDFYDGVPRGVDESELGRGGDLGGDKDGIAICEIVD
jgi:hypothetical protein